MEKIQTNNERNIGLYIHIPFCIQKCPYCDFYSIPTCQFIPDYIDALIKEIQIKSTIHLPVDTIYYGGGTPSVLDPSQIERICESIQNHWQVIQHAEITLEANPGTLTEEKLTAWKSSGINRINLGIQSFHDIHLKQLGRIYTAFQAHQAIDLIQKKGFQNIGLDLIYGIPEQTLDDFEKDLLIAIEYKPEHLSCYSLTYEPETPLYQKMKQNTIKPLSENIVAQMMTSSMDISEQSGYDHYETSNYAWGSEFRSRHNQKYWALLPYLGFGASAHSFLDNRRFWNVKDVIQYIKRLSLYRDPVDGSEHLTPQQHMIEAIFLGLRTQQGIQVKEFEKRFSLYFNDIFSDVLDPLRMDGYIEKTPEWCRLKRSGWFYLDSIIEQMVHCLS
ncbi:MAG: radical SAM family heme chaperone HemW [Candidatus Magnetomorum sp.]|nr:radical SAM family heme chaperone HemW [Candidatus Magnetomorum sp.]